MGYFILYFKNVVLWPNLLEFMNCCWPYKKLMLTSLHYFLTTYSICPNLIPSCGEAKVVHCICPWEKLKELLVFCSVTELFLSLHVPSDKENFRFTLKLKLSKFWKWFKSSECNHPSKWTVVCLWHLTNLFQLNTTSKLTIPPRSNSLLPDSLPHRCSFGLSRNLFIGEERLRDDKEHLRGRLLAWLFKIWIKPLINTHSPSHLFLPCTSRSQPSTLKPIYNSGVSLSGSISSSLHV